MPSHDARIDRCFAAATELFRSAESIRAAVRRASSVSDLYRLVSVNGSALPDKIVACIIDAWVAENRRPHADDLRRSRHDERANGNVTSDDDGNTRIEEFDGGKRTRRSNEDYKMNGENHNYHNSFSATYRLLLKSFFFQSDHGKI